MRADRSSIDGLRVRSLGMAATIEDSPAGNGEHMTTGEPCSRGGVRLAWYVHIFTTSGIVVGMLALQGVFDHKAKTAMWYLLLTQVIDGVDGPLARQYDVKARVPKIDGYVLDLVIDYVTCVIVPAAFMHTFHLLPGRTSLALVGLIVFMSAIWFSRTDMMSDDGWFNGFPAVWNLVAPTMLLLNSNQWVNAVVVVVLCALMLTDVKFPHPVRADDGRNITLPVIVLWLAALTWATFRYPTPSDVGRGLLLASIAYFAGLCVWRTRLSRPR